MSHTFTQTLLVNGPRIAVVHYQIVSDGVSADANERVILTPADAVHNGITPSRFIIQQIWASLTGFSGTLGFNALSDQPTFQLLADNPTYFDFRCFGGLADRTNGVGADHNLVITTKGLNTITSRGTLILEIQK